MFMYKQPQMYHFLTHTGEARKSVNFFSSKHCGVKMSGWRLRDLTDVLRHSGSSGHSGLALLADSSQQLLDLGNGPARVQSLGTSLGAVHDGVAPVD